MPHDPIWIQRQSQITISRLLPDLEAIITDQDERRTFVVRLERNFPRLFELLLHLYGHQYDFFYHLERMIQTAAEMYVKRPADLKARDIEREADRSWFQEQNMVGTMLYVDLFAGDFDGVREKIPYLQELGITYLHLMPLFRAPADNSDGGYAVSSYRHTNPKLGSMEDLTALAKDLRDAGISLVLDFIFNHTSNEHTWALQAREGEERYRDFYRIFPDRTLPDQYEHTLREIFPEQAPGNFTYSHDVGGWVWTTFYDFQWDLNYENPDVLTAMMSEMLFLANVGVEVLRLDAVAFVWKKLGTSCENLPEAHMIIQALNALISVAAPGMIFKSEAIVHPDDVNSYIDWHECPISYNPTLMAMIWDGLATRRADVPTYAMQHRFDLPADCVWVNYVRSHDDIGWSFADDDAARFGVNGYDHRLFLNQFYTGRFDGSFARGLPFNYNPLNQDMRICGTTASLAGLEQALDLQNSLYIRMAVERILMIHSVILSVRGIPLLYMGDEIATLNDDSFRKDPAKAGDNRWAHRPAYDWARHAARNNPNTPAGEIFTRLKHMIDVRKATPDLGDADTTFIELGNPHLLAYTRGALVLCIHNFSEATHTLPRRALAQHWAIPSATKNLATGETIQLEHELMLHPYAYLWLVRDTM